VFDYLERCVPQVRKEGGKMKESPILFSTQMIRAILEERKTKTRRIIKPQFNRVLQFAIKNDHYSILTNLLFRYADDWIKCPYGKPGDRLWVRETWNVYDVSYDDYIGGNEIGYPYKIIPKQKPEKCSLSYAADNRDEGPFRPSIHMPRWASRITLEIINIHTEKLQDITPEDCQAEGIIYDLEAWHMGFTKGMRTAFLKLWNSLNEDRGFGWDVNPFVWVIEFKKLLPDCECESCKECRAKGY